MGDCAVSGIANGHSERVDSYDGVCRARRALTIAVGSWKRRSVGRYGMAGELDKIVVSYP